MSGKRLGIEAIIIGLLVLAIAGIWWWRGHAAGEEIEQLRADRDEQVSVLSGDALRWAGRLSAGEAEAVFRAFAAGVAPQILPGGEPNLDLAVGGLLELPAVDFVHVLAPDGTVLATSDRKLATTGRIGEAERWALGSDDLIRRASSQPGVTELAAPIVGSAGPAGYLWMGYRTQQVMDSSRPSSLSGAKTAGGQSDPGGS